MKSKREYAPKQAIQREEDRSTGTHSFDQNPLDYNIMGKSPLEYDALEYKGGGVFIDHPATQLREKK